MANITLENISRATCEELEDAARADRKEADRFNRGWFLGIFSIPGIAVALALAGASIYIATH